MPIETPKRIHLLGSGRYDEALAGAALTPGHLLAQNSSGKVIKHSGAGASAEKAFAMEDALQGRTIATAFAANEVVPIVRAAPGDHIYAWLAAGEAVTFDDLLTSNGDGTLKVATSTDIRVAAPLEEVDNSDTGAVDVRIRVRIL